MMNKTSQSSDKSPNLDSGVTDSLVPPSWWQWLISALSGTVETEKQIAWLKLEKKRLKQESEKYSAIAFGGERSSIAQQTKKETEQIEKETEQLKKENEQLAVLESKIDGLFSKYNINSNPTNQPEEP
ncbi:hypothetical protein [Halothece sp. PCC 7418]|uniref:hypothetical protein n=1 Tax=Halothece sp. (strain PCC 7418) TaxID=65093 RepID=UPI001493FD54|nr:hypothetical protein [Halothece sp. PCC 7418]